MEEGDTSSSSSIPNPEGDTVVEGSSHGTGTSAKANSSSDGSGSGSASMNTDKSPQDDIEAQLGITEYLSNCNSSSSSSSSSDHDALADQQQLGFTGVVKARYSDFIVHEVSIDGKVARLTDTSLPKEEPKQDLRQEDNQAAQEVAGTPSNEADMTDPPTGSTKASSERSKQETLSQLIKNETIAANVFTMLQSHTDTSKEISTGSVEKFVTLPALEKSERKAVHEWVRSALPNEARADTLDGKIRIWHIKYEKEMPNYETFSNNRSSNNNRGSGNRGRNNNDDRQNHKRIKKEWPPDRPDFLRFVLYKENMDTTTATKEVNRRGSTGRIGYAGMKDKRGVTTQFCTLYRTTPDQIVTSTSTNSRFQNNKPSGGGGNTKEKGVSVVQVGNFEYVEKELRLGMLNGNRFDIIIRNIKALDEKEDDNHSSGNDTSEEIRLRRRAVLEAAAQAVKAKGFINYFGTQRFGKFHDTHLVGIAVLKGDYRKAVDILMSPKPDDRPDVTKARQDWEDRFQNGKNEDTERDAAKRVLKRMNRYMTAEISVMQSLAKRPMDYKRAFGCIPRNLRAMYIHAVQSLIWNKAASYRVSRMDSEKALVGDLVLGEFSKYNVHVVTEEDVASNKYSIEDVVIPSVGVKTTYPSNELGSVIKSLLGDIGITADMFKKVQDRELILNGDYRKVICHPTDFDYEIKEYYDPLQPLIQTDLMKLHGEEIRIEPQPSKNDDDVGKTNTIMKTAMVVGFTLPSSSYATIALRELMKLPTSNEFQKEQAL